MQHDGKWLSEVRRSLKMTQQELAEAVGVARNYIYMIESGRKPMTESIMIAVEKLEQQGTLTANLSWEEKARLAVKRAEVAEAKLQKANEMLDMLMSVAKNLKEAVR